MREKARYTGGKTTETMDFLDPDLKDKLCKIYREEKCRFFSDSEKMTLDEFEIEFAKDISLPSPPEGKTRADVFSEELMQVARSYLHVPEVAMQMCNKNDLLKEADTFYQRLKSLAENLQRISPGILNDDRGIPSLIDNMEELAHQFKQAVKGIKTQGSRPRTQEILKANTLDLVEKVLLILHKHHVPITASGTSVEGNIIYQSVAVKILVTINHAVGLPDSDLTVRDYITKLLNSNLRSILKPV